MKKLFKLAVIVVLLLIVLAGIAFAWALNHVDELARQGVEYSATQSLGVETTLAGLDIGFFRGTCEIDNLAVANPPGYDSDPFLSLKHGEVALTYNTLREKTVELPYLTLTGATMNLHKQGEGGNYQVIMDNIGRNKTETPAEPTGYEKGYVIRTLTIKDVTANVTTDILGKTSVSVPIPEIVLKDVGSESDYGAQLAEVTDTIVRAILLEVVRNGVGVLPKELLGQLTGGLEELGPIANIPAQAIGDATKIAESLSDAGKALLDKDGSPEKAVEKVGEAVGDAKNVVEGIGGLFKKKDSDD